MDLKSMQQSKKTITLREPMPLDRLHALMVENAGRFPGKFKLKKGLFGSSITFDVLMQIQPVIKVKDNTVTIRKIQNKTQVGIGGGPMADFKHLQQTANAVKEGGFKKAITGGAEYFLQVCSVLEELLAQHM